MASKPRRQRNWDEELLTIELAELKLEGFDLSPTGFGEVARRAAR
jgi:hypothetical protein